MALESLMSKVKLSQIEQEYTVSYVEKEQLSFIYRECELAYDLMGPVVNILFSAAKEKVNGSVFLLDRSPEHDNTYLIGLPVKKLIENVNVTNEILPVQNGIQITHFGPYENINRAYKFLIDYVKQHNINVSNQFRTTFIKGSGKVFKGNPNKFITEIFLPINNCKENKSD